MCKYCECEDGFRIIDIYKSIQPFGNSTTLETRLLMFCPYDDDYMDEETANNDYRLNIEVGVGSHGDDLLEDIYIPVNFCPFCGRCLAADALVHTRLTYENYIRVPEVLKLLKISRQTFYGWVDRGLKGKRLPVRKLSRRTVEVNMGDLTEFLRGTKYEHKTERLLLNSANILYDIKENDYLEA